MNMVEAMNKFKGLDIVNSVPEELWTEVHNIVQEAVNKTIPKKNKWKKAKQLAEEALQIVEEKRAVKSKDKKGKLYPTECNFQRIARRDKKAFFNELCKSRGKQ